MKNIILTIGLIILSLNLNAQVKTYKLKELYNFKTEPGKNPFVEFVEGRETVLLGGKSEDGKEIIMTVNEDSGFVKVNNPYANGVKIYPILRKEQMSENYVSFLMMGPNGPFAYVYSRQSPTVVNVYCFWTEIDGQQLGYQSVVRE